METKMGFRHKFAYSFFNFAAYKEFLVQGLGKSILYLFLVTLILSTLTNINTIDIFTSELSIVESTFIHSAPNFELKDGLLSVGSDEPIYYKRDGALLVVDTSGKTNLSAIDNYSDGMYIDSNTISIRKNDKLIQTANFSDFSDLVVTNEIMKDSLSMMKILFPIVLLILNPIISFVYNLITVFLVLAPLSLLLISFKNMKIKYKNACILSCYAMTLPLLLQSLLDISGIGFPGFQSMFYAIALTYCWLAINEIRKTDKSNLNFIK